MSTRKSDRGGGAVRLSESKLRAIIAETIQKSLNEIDVNRGKQFNRNHDLVQNPYRDDVAIMLAQRLEKYLGNCRVTVRTDEYSKNWNGQRYESTILLTIRFNQDDSPRRIPTMIAALNKISRFLGKFAYIRSFDGENLVISVLRETGHEPVRGDMMPRSGLHY